MLNEQLIQYLNNQIELRQNILAGYQARVDTINQLNQELQTAQAELAAFGDVETIKAEVADLLSYVEYVKQITNEAATIEKPVKEVKFKLLNDRKNKKLSKADKMETTADELSAVGVASAIDADNENTEEVVSF